MKKGKKLYEGKAKILYAAPEKGTIIQHFKDHATAFNNQKKTNAPLYKCFSTCSHPLTFFSTFLK